MRFKFSIMLLLSLATVHCWIFSNGAPNVSMPKIVSLSSHEIMSDELIGDFIEFVEGENISLLCNTVDYHAVTYHLPDLTGYEKFDQDDYLSRKKAGQSQYNKTLTITNAKVTDTGSYDCSIYNDRKRSHRVYVFVRANNKYDCFISMKTRNTYYENGRAIVPCLTNQNVNESNIELWTSGMKWNGEGISYDPRKGFQISTAEKQLLREHLSLTCIFSNGYYDTDRSHFTNKEFFDKRYEVMWEEAKQWLHVRQTFNLTCNVQHDVTGGFVTVQCPRCKKVTFERYGDLHRLIATVEQATMGAAGLYECQILINGTLYKQATVNVVLSPTMGQIQLEHVSPRIIVISEDYPYQIQVNFTRFPLSTKNYSTAWTRKYMKATRGREVSLEMITNKSTTTEYSNNLASEELNLQGIKANGTGIYILTIRILDLVETIEFNVTLFGSSTYFIQVTVQSKKPKVTMTLPTPTNYTFLGQKYYRSGSHVGVFCKVKSVPLADTIILSSRQPLSHWKVVAHDDLEIIEGTYETLVVWDTIVKQSQEVLCRAKRGQEWDDDILNIGVADGKPTAVGQHIRNPLALEGEDEKETYEGDSIELSCVHPKNADWHVVWMHDETEIPIEEVNITSDNVSRILKISLSNVSATDSDVYTCVLVNSKEKTPLVLSVPVNVLKTQKPSVLSTYKESLVELQYGTPASISCPLTGIPKPKIEWFKDGQLYESGASDENGTLTIQRVNIEDKGIFTCKAKNRVGETEISFTAKVVNSPYNFNTVFIIIGVVAFALLAMGLACVGYMYYKQKKTNKSQVLALGKLYEQLMNQIPTYLGNQRDGERVPLDQRLAEIAYDRRYELEKDQLTVGNILGTGKFGKVCRGTLARGDDQYRTIVAIKQPLIGSNPEHQTMLVQELKIMCALDNHPHVIALLGAVTKFMKTGELYVVVEFCNNGNLKDYIVDRRANFINELSSQELNDDGTPKTTQYASEAYVNYGAPEDTVTERQVLLSDPASLSTSDLLSFALQIAKGMNYLANVPCVHRDLALRNILVTSNGVLRIADFGLARNIHKEYYRMQRKGKKRILLPMRWMSIEAIEQGLYTVASDIWSYGIVLYELFSLAGLPYPSIGNEDLVEKLKTGYRNPKPKYCHEDIYRLMEQCCQEEAKHRPNFNRCVEVTKTHLRRCNSNMLIQLEAKVKVEAEEQKRLVQWARQEERTQPIRHNSFVEIPQEPKRQSSILRSLGSFLGTLRKKPFNTASPIVEAQEPESIPLTETRSPAPEQPQAEIHPHNGNVLTGSPPPNESYASMKPRPQSEPYIEGHPPSDVSKGIHSSNGTASKVHTPSESYMPMAPLSAPPDF